MPRRPPTLSIVVPSFDTAPFVAATLASLFAQTMRDLEVIVVDDGSRDDSLAVLRRVAEPRLTVISQPNRGLAAARNAGLLLARGGLVGFCDADDVWSPRKAERHLAVFAAAPGVGLTFSYSAYLREDGSATGRYLVSRCRAPSAFDLTQRNHVGNGSTVIARRDLFRHAGLFDETLGSCEDVDMWVRAAACSPYTTMLFSPNWGVHSTHSFLQRGGRTCGNSRAAEQNLLRHADLAVPTEGNYYSTTSAANDALWVMPPSFHPASHDYRSFFRLPPAACPSPDTDGMMAVFQPDGWAIDLYAGVVTSEGKVLATMASWIDLRGDGTGWWNGRRASMLPSFAGLIRRGELRAGRIPHALAAQVPPAMLRRGAVWPAYAFDRDSGYGGTLPMGALLAIPPSVPIEALGLSPFGRVIARAAQDYGVYVVDRGGGGITLLAELGNPDIRWPQDGGDPPWWRDVEIIKNALRRVTNNTPTTRGGGGMPRVPLAPHLRLPP